MNKVILVTIFAMTAGCGLIDDIRDARRCAENEDWAACEGVVDRLDDDQLEEVVEECLDRADDPTMCDGLLREHCERRPEHELCLDDV